MVTPEGVGQRILSVKLEGHEEMMRKIKGAVCQQCLAREVATLNALGCAIP